MAFITPCCKNALERLVRPVLRVLCGLLLVAASHAFAGSIETRKAVLNYAEEGTTLSAEFAIDLGPRLKEAVTRGVSLYFVLEFELTHPRWWWANEYVVGRTVNYRLSYNALTQQYRLSAGSLHYNFPTLDEALRLLSRVTLVVADRGVLKVGETYAAGLRLSLDRNQLPKPLQIDAIGNSDLQVESRVHRWTFVPALAPSPVPAEAKNGEAKP